MRIFISSNTNGVSLETIEEKYHYAELFLKTRGYKAVNPLGNGLKPSDSFKVALVKRLKLLKTCDGIFFLPGWIDSDICHVEYKISDGADKEILFQSRMLNDEISIVHHKIDLLRLGIYKATGLHISDYTTPSRERSRFYARMLFTVYAERIYKLNENQISIILKRKISVIRRYHIKLKETKMYTKEFQQMIDIVEDTLRVQSKYKS